MIDSITPKPYFHAANSGAILDLPETWLDMVRPGCLIYGLYPSNEVKEYHLTRRFPLKVVLLSKGGTG